MNANVLRMMAAKGLTIEDAIEIMEAMEAESAPRSKGAERQARYRARNAEPSPRDVTRDVTSDAEISPSLSPPPRTPPPRSHPREEISPARKGRPAKPSETDDHPDLERIWQAANQTSRDRSGRPQASTAIRAALAEGATADAILASVSQHCRTGGDHAKGLHRIVNAKLWRDHIAALPSTSKPPDPQVAAGRQLHFQKTGEWRSEWGPRPSPAPANQPTGKAA